MEERRVELSVGEAEAFAQRVLAAIDADEAGTPGHHDADRARVAADLEGLRRAHRHPGRGLEEADLEWLRRAFSDGLVRTGDVYGVRP